MRKRSGARVLAVWCPDWPAVAAAAVGDVPPIRPVVVLHANRVVACSAVARGAGVRRGLKRREAQARCPDMYVAQADPDRDARLFEPVVAAVDATVPGVEVLRPGLLVLGARGAARFFGSEEAAAERLIDAVAAVGVECQIGIADELSTAVIAARRAAIVAPGSGANFLAPLPVAELALEPSLAAPEREELVDLLHRLGLRRIGDFAALTPAEVASRFDADAIRAHRCARAEPERPPSSRPPAPDLTVEYHCDPPIERVDAAAFAGRLLATHLHDRLSAAGVACTRLAVIAETAAGEQLSRIWRCAEPLTPEGTADRIRWQLDGWLTHRTLTGATPNPDAAFGRIHGRATPEADPTPSPARPSTSKPVPAKENPPRTAPTPTDTAKSTTPKSVPSAPIILLRLEPVEVVAAGALQLGLWGGVGEEDERARRALVRVQGLLGGEAVRIGVLSGGRGPAERITLVALGDEPVPATDPESPWPGRLPPPTPAVVLMSHPEVMLEADDGTGVWISERGLFTAEPARLRWGGKQWAVTGWAGPWLLDERWWSGDRPGDYAIRAQVMLDEQFRVLLLLGYAGSWHVEGLYE
ncbi:DNA polymerase Y family protein [Nocardia sp. CDC159]|uniref:DNA polymerase Y family protein n=1 Tax=Nocardia pulmonis TaxID=2951408 RepID=A0A9X2IYY7_9NOCA|nr:MULTISPECIES: DNA polymerase Y family protein [Nocardia]MCM6776199.1 DNA polymerase Y family protein [Nocardia pulmonis]MCM6788475.1 DNA polymerase Y family protein [Nocardia sp. CDC159]